MAHKIYVNENEIRWMNKLADKGMSIKEIAKETHRSETTVKKFTKETRAKKRQQSIKQMSLDLDDPTILTVGDVDDNGMIELKMGRSVMYLTVDDVATLVTAIARKFNEKVGF